MKNGQGLNGVFIEWRGKNLLLAEGIDALLKYGDGEILLGAGEDRISVRGEGLEMKYLTEDRIAVEGAMKAVSYENV